jgi:hypothetical protein
MTLRVVSDAELGDADIIPIGLSNPRLIPDMAREFANMAERGEFGMLISATLVIESADGVETVFWGETPTRTEIIGLLEVAKAKTLSELLDEYGGEE